MKITFFRVYFVYGTQMTQNKILLCFLLREKSACDCFMVFVLLFYIICDWYAK